MKDDVKASLSLEIDRAVRAVEAGDVAGLAEAWQAYGRGFPYQQWLDGRVAPALPHELGLHLWNRSPAYWHYPHVIIAKFGYRALPGLVDVLTRDTPRNLKLAASIGAVELAPLIGSVFIRLKSARQNAGAWLLKFPEHAATGLLPLALGAGSVERDSAAICLRYLAGQGHEALIRDVARKYDRPDVMTATDEVLDEDPLDRYPVKIGKPPAWWQPRGWRRPVLAANGKVLPDTAIEHLGAMLRFPVIEGIYAGLADVQDACTPASLADFAWDIFAAWLECGAHGRDGWVMTALTLFGNDDTARRLTPLIRVWPGESRLKLAEAGLDILVAIGSDTALMQLNGMALKSRYNKLKEMAQERIGRISEARGLTREELEDRLTPDLGLDAHGRMRLDFGPRQFVVGFDEMLSPFVRDSEGARLPALPRPKKTDDAELAREAVARYKVLKQDVSAIAEQQVRRLETAMCARRRWPVADFRLLLAEHPLLRHLVQRLVWGVYAVAEKPGQAEPLLACFRVAEDGACTTAGDDHYELPPEDRVRIGIPHALELAPADAAAFGQLFADYELLQPFPQLGRGVFALTPVELLSGRVARWKGREVPTVKLLGLQYKGWSYAHYDGPRAEHLVKSLLDEGVAILDITPGITAGDAREHPRQTLGDIQLSQHWSKRGGLGPKPNMLEAIALSEMVRELEAVCA